MAKHQTFTYTIEGDETSEVRQTRSGAWLLEDTSDETPAMPEGMERYFMENRDSDPVVNAVRDGQLVQVRWSQLTEDERRAANEQLFQLNNC